jgi:formamidopyrimidine-DNA glycosylase
VRRVEILRADLIGTPARDFRRFMEGAGVDRVGRRGKNLVLRMRGPRDGTPFALVINLGMSGRLLMREAGDRSRSPSHPGVRFRLEGGGQLVYHDIRRFGRLGVMDPEALGRWSRSLGPEPLARAFTAPGLADALARSSAPIRSWLLDQRKVAGVGNIYANEALFVARVHPATPARTLPPERSRALHGALRSVLREAIRARGTTLRDYRTAHGLEGGYAPKLRVYGREGGACARCRTPVRRVAFGGRSAYFCPSCQGEGTT